MSTRYALTILLAAILPLTLPTTSSAATRHVGAGQTYSTIQSAVDAASPGDSIVVHDGTYVENVTVSTPVAIVSQDFLDNGEYDSAILDAGSNYMTGITISSGGTSVEGLSFTAVWSPAYAIHVSSAPGCRIANNRFGWDEDHAVATGVNIDKSDDCVVEYNFVGRAYNSGVYISQSTDTDARHNTFQYVAGNGGYAIALSGMYDVGINGSDCRGSNIALNNFSNCYAGVYASGYITNTIVQANTFTDNLRGVFFGKGGVLYNTIVGNTFSMNGINIVLDGASFNTVVNNSLDGDATGIRIGYSSPYGGSYNLIIMNSIRNHTLLGLYIGSSAHYNRMVMNHFAGNAVNVESHGTDWNSPTPVSYFYGPNHKNLLGNYYESYTGTDSNGDGVGDTGLPFDDGNPTTGPSESYPLMSPPDQYAIEAWYLQADTALTMFHRDMNRPILDMEVAGSAQHVWISDEPASGNVDYPTGTWTGCMSFETSTNPDEFTVEIGSSSNGTDFTASGAQALIGGGISNLFETSAAAVSVPEGHYLAVRLTNNTEWPYKLTTGGLLCYVSSTGNGDPAWPGDVTAIQKTTPPRIALRQNYPNPFNPATTIEFSVPERIFATLRVYDVRGRRVATLFSGMVPPGSQEVRWDARDHRGNAVGSGIYFYRLQAGDNSVTRKMVLLR